MSKILEKLLTTSRRRKQAMLIGFDASLLSFFFLLAMWFRLDSFEFIHDPNVWIAIAITTPTCIMLFVFFGIYRSMLRYLSVEILRGVGIGLLISTILFFVASQFFVLQIPRSVSGIYFAISFIGISGARFLIYKLFSIAYNRKRKPVVIYGSGAAGRQLLSALKKDYEYKPVFFIDDDKSLNNRVINGLSVFSFKEAVGKIEQEKIETVLLAMPSISLATRKTILDKLTLLSIEIKTMPSLADIIEGRTEISRLRHINIEELLARDTISPKNYLMEATIKGKSVLVTGAGGSIGSELCRQILNHEPKILILFDHSEYNLYQIDREINKILTSKPSSTKVVTKLGSVQDSASISDIFETQNIDTIYHAAAYKHVPLIEGNCIEAVRNNVLGTHILATAALKANVKHFILISTDKAVRPTNIMGTTKRLAEMVCQSLNTSSTSTIFSIVRFGNVLGSSGSVIPLFSEQIKNGGPITVTHKDVTRFFMTITEAAQLVIQASSLAKGGEVFLLDMGKPIKIIDLARQMASLQGLKVCFESEENHDCDIKIKITGLRPGEKLFEELLINNNACPTAHQRIMMADEKFVSAEIIDRLINQLQMSCADNDRQKTVSLLLTSPTGYCPL